jgi:micrococcal nuclease
VSDHLTFTYRAQLERVVDGDTLHVRCDLGLRLTYAMDVRLRGCNADEKTTPSGQAAITFAISWLANNADADGWLTVTTHRNPEDPYGRWMADVTNLDGSKSLAVDLIAAGLAVVWDGKGPKPVPKLVPPDLPPAA